MPDVRVVTYIDAAGRSAFLRWFEYRIDFGPGYRIYFGKDGEFLVVLLGGSSKKRQQRAIEAARDAWKEYRRRKAPG